jgi:hypothetical protein
MLYTSLGQVVNADAWLGFMPLQVKFEDLRYTRKPRVENIPWWAESDNKYFYWDVQFEYLTRYEGWNPTRLLNAGPYAKRSASDTKLCMAKEGNQVAHGRKILLNENGTAMDISNPNNVTPNYRSFVLSGTANFRQVFAFANGNPWAA